MAATKNSKPSPTSKRRTRPSGSAASASFVEYVLAFLFLACVSAAAAAWFLAQGYTLYFGDALAHLNIARRILDSRTPGYDQIGTVWLPLPHLLLMPLAARDDLWRSGLAGVIPSAACFVIAGMFLFAICRRLFPGAAAALTAIALFALNPNMLYLQSIPMTEAIFFACLMAMLFSIAWLERSGSFAAVVCCGLAGLAATLTRYDGWFLIPFAALAVFYHKGQRRFSAAILFCTIASLGPLYWLAHNWRLNGYALEFYDGPWSAIGIYRRALKNGGEPARTEGHWIVSARYYWAAVQLCAGPVLPWIGAAGVVAALIQRRFMFLLLLLAPALFYIVSLHGQGGDIHVPQLWPNSYYNTRYGLVAVPLFAFAAAALVAAVPERFRSFAMIALVLASIAPWLAYPRAENWITWKESQVNSNGRRFWTQEAAAYFRENYHGGGIFTPFGDLTGIYREAGIPLKETLHDGNNPAFDAAIARPDLFLHEEWAVSFAGEQVATAVQRAGRRGPRYRLMKIIVTKDSPVLEIYKRD